MDDRKIINEVDNWNQAQSPSTDEVNATSTSAERLDDQVEQPDKEVLISPTQVTLSHGEHRQIQIEVLVVLLLAVLPDLANGLLYLVSPRPRPHFLLEGVFLIVRSAQVSAPVLYLIWRSSEGWKLFGFCRPRWIQDALLGFLGYVACKALYGFAIQIGPIVELVSSFDPLANGRTQLTETVHGIPLVTVACVLGLVNGFAEELVMRAFLITRLQQLTKSSVLSVAFSTFLFASYHAYQGTWGILYTGICGIVMGVLFCMVRRLWPVVVAHAILDFVGWTGS